MKTQTFLTRLVAVLVLSVMPTSVAWDDDTFKDAGKVGVWTKAGSVTLFDDFSYGTK